jgi:hypothetical protein
VKLETPLAVGAPGLFVAHADPARVGRDGPSSAIEPALVLAHDVRLECVPPVAGRRHRHRPVLGVQGPVCGSGRKVKRCCAVSRGPSEQSLAQATFRTAARAAARSVRGLSGAEFAVLVGELADVPSVDLALQAELPKLLSPALGRLCGAAADDDELTGEAVLDDVLDEINTPLERARLARAVIAAGDAGRLEARLAATALVDLASGS